MQVTPVNAAASSRFARVLDDCPQSPCVIFHADNLDDTLEARIAVALVGAASSVLVLCAAGQPILNARAQVRMLHQALQPMATRLGARVSRSATEGLAVWAASTIGPIGVDVQSRVTSLDGILLELALDPAERLWLEEQACPEAAFTRLWSAKEAALKAFGVGLAWSPSAVPVAPPTECWRTLNVPALGQVWLINLATPVMFKGALAVAINVGHPSQTSHL